MTPGVIAAHQAADRAGYPSTTPDTKMVFPRTQLETRDLYVRAFLAGARHTEQALVKELDALDALATSDHQYDRGMRCSTDHLRDWLEEFTRVEPLNNSPTPATGSTASPDTGESPQRGKS